MSTILKLKKKKKEKKGRQARGFFQIVNGRLQINNNLPALNGQPALTGESLKAPEERLL